MREVLKILDGRIDSLEERCKPTEDTILSVFSEMREFAGLACEEFVRVFSMQMFKLNNKGG